MSKLSWSAIPCRRCSLVVKRGQVTVTVLVAFSSKRFHWWPTKYRSTAACFPQQLLPRTSAGVGTQEKNKKLLESKLNAACWTSFSKNNVFSGFFPTGLGMASYQQEGNKAIAMVDFPELLSVALAVLWGCLPSYWKPMVLASMLAGGKLVMTAAHLVSSLIPETSRCNLML